MGHPPQVWISHSAQLLDGDCACPVATTPGAVSAAPQQFHAGTWQQAPATFRRDLVDDWSLLFNLNGNGTVAVLNPAAQQFFDSFIIAQCPPAVQENSLDGSAWQVAFTALATAGLLQPVNVQREAPPPNTLSTLSAWLHLTNQCNLRCTYCYLDKNHERMSPAIGTAAVEAIFRAARLHGFQAVSLKYAGGEAALNFSVLRLIHEEALQRAAADGILLQATLLSNGTVLSPRLLDYLYRHGIGLMVSLDGIGTVHDQQRPTIGAQGSFAQVDQSLDRALAHGVCPHLSITVTAENAGFLAETVRYALDKGLRFNLNFYRDPDQRQHSSTLRAGQAQLIRGLLAAFDIIAQKLPNTRLIDSMIDRSAFHGAHEHPCGAGHSYLVIDHHGHVARCQMEIEKPISSVFAADPLHTLRAHSHAFNLPAAAKEGCRSCEWQPWCAGGCPVLTLRATGRTDIQSPYCNVYKAIFPELLKLEGLRLLKYGQNALRFCPQGSPHQQVSQFAAAAPV